MRIHILSDSNSIVNWLNGRWKKQLSEIQEHGSADTDHAGQNTLETNG